MRSRLLLIPAIIAATAGLGVSGAAFASQPDAQAQAAALLSPSYEPIAEVAVSPQSVAADAHAHAAALLSGALTSQGAKTSERIPASRADRTSRDAQAQAAALLRGAPITISESPRISATNETLGDHPAVVVARAWSKHGVDPNTFIVAHPARLQLLAASPIETDVQPVVVTASTVAPVSGSSQ